MGHIMRIIAFSVRQESGAALKELEKKFDEVSKVCSTVYSLY